MNVIIFGTGAMACLYGAQLSRTANVHLFGHWREAIEQINRDGILVRRDEGISRFRVNAHHSLEDLPTADIAIVLVKSYQTEPLAEEIRKWIKPDTVLLTLQNGLGNDDILRNHLPGICVASGVTTYGAYSVAPGEIQFGGDGVVWITKGANLESAFVLFRDAGLDVRQTDDLQSLQWGKLVVNSGLNPLTAIYQIRNGYLCDFPSLRALYLDIVEETAQLAEKLAIKLPYPSAKEMAIDVAMRTMTNKSSMFCDLQNNRRTEIDAITGAILQHAKKADFSAPLNSWMYRMVKIAEQVSGKGFA